MDTETYQSPAQQLRKFTAHHIRINFKDHKYTEKLMVERAMSAAHALRDNEIENLKNQLTERNKLITSTMIEVEKANDVLKLAHEENETMKKALEQIANQTDDEVMFDALGSARQIAIAALKNDQ